MCTCLIKLKFILKDPDTKDYTETKHLEGNPTESKIGEFGQPPAVRPLPDEDSADHYVPRRLFLINVVNLKVYFCTTCIVFIDKIEIEI